MKDLVKIVGAITIFLWAISHLGVGDFVYCFGPAGHCQSKVCK